MKQPRKIEQQVTPPIKVLMQIYHNVLKQGVAKSNISEYVSVGEKIMLRL